MQFFTQNIISTIIIALLLSLCPLTVHAAPSLPAGVAERLSRGIAQDLIVLYEDGDVENEATALRRARQKEFDDDVVLAVRRERYRTIKQSVRLKRQTGDVEELRDYDHLPMSLLRANSRAALERLLADPRVKAVYENLPVYPHLSYSLPFIGQPAVAGAGFSGSGRTVAVIDTGINYLHSAFGCTSPGVPASCKVAAAVDVNGNDNLVTTANNHGTNVAGIVAGVAPGAKIASFNALPGGSGSTSDVIAGINWAITNKSAFNITAINLSLGDNTRYTSFCSSIHSNPYVSPINNARTAGIIPVASSGNSGYSDGISSPACTPGVVSVGAVYDTNWGGPFTWTTSGCTDSTTAADKIPCFSNSASFLTMLAPGAYITAAGIQMAGTSQAAPHVAGAVAVLRAASPADTLDQTVARLTSGGISVTDSRNGITKPRLNLRAAIDASVPTVTLTAPAPGSTVSGAVTVTASASDNIGVSRVEFYLDSVLKFTARTIPYSFNWDTTIAANGSHTLSAKSYDTVGNVGQSGNVAVTVFNDLIAPAVSMTSPAPDSTVSGAVTVTASASDNIGVSRVEFYLDNVLQFSATTAPFGFDWDTTTAADGSHILYARAYDAAGNVGQSSSISVMVSQAEAVPALSPWGMLVAALCLAGAAAGSNSKTSQRPRAG